MKQSKKTLDKNSEGDIKLTPETNEDMWHLYNLIAIGDRIRASADRKVQSESSTGSVNTQRVHTMLTIAVESINYDTYGGKIHVKGRNVSENQYVKMGAYHTLDLEVNRAFTLHKALWDTVSLQRINDACDPAQNAEVAAVVMDVGLAHLCLITTVMTTVRAKIEVNVPRKRKGFNDQHKTGMEKFFKQVADAIRRHINFEITKCVLLASPGFVKEEFFDYLLDYARRESESNDGKSAKAIIDNKGKFIIAHSASGHKSALTEVLSHPAVQNRIADTKAFKEVRLLGDLERGINEEPAISRAVYGVKAVEYAADSEAVDTLLITDSLFRSKTLSERQRYVRLVDRVTESRGEFVVLSSLHVTGEQLDRMTGVGALLRFPLPDIEDYLEDDLVDNVGDTPGTAVNGHMEV